MSMKDLYEELTEMVESASIGAAPPSPECVKVVRLLYKPSEAKLALQIGIEGGTLKELSEKTGMKEAELKKMLHTMANKSTIFYDPVKTDPTYRVVGGPYSPGWVDAALWGGIRFPYSVEEGKAPYEVLNSWFPPRLKKAKELGFPMGPVWAATLALPKETLASENVAEALKEKGNWSVSPCPCRLTHWLTKPGEHCSHMLEVCIQTGEISLWAVKHGMGRELSYDQVVELLQKCEQDGLVHTGDLKWDVLCNCCDDCCALFVGERKPGEIHSPSPFIVRIEAERCNACGICVERCPVDAINVDGSARINTEICLGCGVCVVQCGQGAMALVRRTAVDGS